MTSNQGRNRFGTIAGVSEGTIFRNRLELSQARIHAPTQNGISGTQTIGCDSIVLSGKYLDEDYDDVIIYSGENPRGGSDADNQILAGGNRALEVSHDNELPVRVTRGSKTAGGPTSGYRYDGLYRVVRCFQRPENGRVVWRFQLDKLHQPRATEISVQATPARHLLTLDRIIRDAALAERIKRIHSFACQICGESLMSPNGPYAEAAHIRPLGRPDDGPDVQENILCLCPNHHKLLDNGGIIVDENWQVIRLPDEVPIGELKRSKRHRLPQEYLLWHRAIWSDHHVRDR